MPDHVKNPERYTCYDLGESITIGGGDQGSSADGGRGEMERVSHSTCDAYVGIVHLLNPLDGLAMLKDVKHCYPLNGAIIRIRLCCMISALVLYKSGVLKKDTPGHEAQCILCEIIQDADQAPITLRRLQDKL